MVAAAVLYRHRPAKLQKEPNQYDFLGSMRTRLCRHLLRCATSNGPSHRPGCVARNKIAMIGTPIRVLCLHKPRTSCPSSTTVRSLLFRPAR